MKKNLRETYLSKPRYNRYLLSTENDSNRAKKLYNANILLAQSFHPILSQFEVVLRNSINLRLASYFDDEDWIINQKNGFMKNNNLHRSDFFIKKCVQKSEAQLTKRSIPITSGRIVSDQNFGFWLALFLPHHYSLIGGQPIQIFQHKPLNEDRASLYTKLNEVREFRNRVNHCEPICFSGQNIDCSYALAIRTKIYHLIQWINPELIPFFEKIDSVPSKVVTLLKI